MRKLFAILFVLFFSITVFSQQPTASNQNAASSESLVKVVRQLVTIPKISTSPVIDGKLDDEIWKQAAVLKDFIQVGPGDHIAPSKPTETYIAYDEKNLYVAFKCWDEKDKISARIVQRDRVSDEDHVRFVIDTYDDQRRAYALFFNPLGIQQDGILTEGQGYDYNVDILMESKGLIEDWGWSVEVRIPFKSLRYSAGTGKFWGVNAYRIIRRLNNEAHSWVPLPRGAPGILNKFGKLTGLDEIKTERTLEIIPTLTMKETGRRVSQTEFSNPPIEPDFGFTAKFSISPNVTLDAAYNPDFADTEADAPVVEANQRFPIFFSEKRPFFLEGVDVFQTPIRAVHTRRIENPDIAVKLTGKTGKNSFGIFGAVDDPLANPFKKKAFIGVVRLKRDVGAESSLGFLATSYDYPEKHNQLTGFDALWKINKRSEFRGQILGSTARNFFYNPDTDSSDYKTGNGVSFSYLYSYSTKHFFWEVGGDGTSRNYRADVGFIDRTNSMQNYFFVQYNADQTPQEFIIRRAYSFISGIRNDFDGRWQNWYSRYNVSFVFKGNADIVGGLTLNAEKIYEDEFGARRNAAQSGAFFGDPTRRAFPYGGFISFSKRFSKRFALNSNFTLSKNSFDFDFGAGRKFPRVSPAALLNPNNPLDPGAGTSLSFGFGIDLKPTDSFSLLLTYNKSKLERDDTGLAAFDSNIFSLRSTYQFSRFVSLKARLDYNTLNSRIFGQYTFAWTPSPGKALYIGYNDNWNYRGFTFGQQQRGFLQLNRTFFIKLSYLFRHSF